MIPAEIITAAADLINEAVDDHREGELRPGDFFALARAAEQVLDALYSLNATLGRELARCGEQGRLRAGAGRSPEQVLAAAMTYARTLHDALREARRTAGLLTGEFARPAFLPAPADAPQNGAPVAGGAAPRADGQDDDDDVIILRPDPPE